MSDWIRTQLSAALPGRPFRENSSRRLYDAEMAGITTAFRVRLCGVAVISAWLVISTEWPRNLYYLAISFAFLLLSLIPYTARRQPFAWPIKLICTILDVMLVTSTILLPPFGDFASEWPVQTRTRGSEYLYVLLLLAESALTYSPILVLWTGGVIITVWSFGITRIYNRPDTVRFGDVGDLTDIQALSRFLSAHFVSLSQMWIQVVTTVLLTIILAVAVHRSRKTLIAQITDNVVRETLSLYVSPDVAQAMSDETEPDFGKPSRRHVAVMFVDVVGFTRMSENRTPEQVLALLASFQKRSCEVIFNHGGTLDKFIGDGLMVTFGGVEDCPDAAKRALECAFALLDSYSAWSEKRIRTGLQRVDVAIGLHFGEVVVGNVGTSTRREFTVIGDVVNVASRLERATRELNGRLVVSDACVIMAGGVPKGRLLTRVLKVEIKGRNGLVDAHIL